MNSRRLQVDYERDPIVTEGLHLGRPQSLPPAPTHPAADHVIALGKQSRQSLEGNQADEFIKHWTKLVQERQELEELGESTGVADRKLERLVGGVPFGAAAVPGTGPNEDAADAAPRRARKAAAR